MPNVQKLKEKEAQMLENLCRDSPFDDTVSFARFCYVVGWFGPLSNNCAPFFARMKDCISKPFFYGFLSDSQSALIATCLGEHLGKKIVLSCKIFYGFDR